MSLVDLDPTVDHGYPAGWDSLEDPERYESAAPDFPDEFYGFDTVELSIDHGGQRVRTSPALGARSRRQIRGPRGTAHRRLARVFSVRNAGGRSTTPYQKNSTAPTSSPSGRSSSSSHVVNWHAVVCVGFIPRSPPSHGRSRTMVRAAQRGRRRGATIVHRPDVSPTPAGIRNTLKTRTLTQQRYVTRVAPTIRILSREHLLQPTASSSTSTRRRTDPRSDQSSRSSRQHDSRLHLGPPATWAATGLLERDSTRSEAC